MCKTICTQLCLLLVLLSCSLFLIMHMYWWLEIAQWLREHVLLCRGPSLDSHTHVRWLVNCLQLRGVLMPLTFTGTCIHMYTHISVKKLCVHLCVHVSATTFGGCWLLCHWDSRQLEPPCRGRNQTWFL